MLRVGACALHESLEDEYVLDKTEDCVRICTHSGRAEAKARMRACAGVSSVNAYPSRVQILDSARFLVQPFFNRRPQLRFHKRLLDKIDGLRLERCTRRSYVAVPG